MTWDYWWIEERPPWMFPPVGDTVLLATALSAAAAWTLEL